MDLIRKLLAGSFILGGFIICLNLLQAQEAEVPAIQIEPLSLTPADLITFTSLTEAQAAALASMLDTVLATKS
jgi:hypothetical protein